MLWLDLLTYLPTFGVYILRIYVYMTDTNKAALPRRLRILMFDNGSVKSIWVPMRASGGPKYVHQRSWISDCPSKPSKAPSLHPYVTPSPKEMRLSQSDRMMSSARADLCTRLHHRQDGVKIKKLNVFTADLLHYHWEKSLAASKIGSLELHIAQLLHLISLTTVVRPMSIGITLY